METPADRLRKARLDAGYATAIEASSAFGYNRNSYASSENGNRGVTAAKAALYAAAFGVRADWILYGPDAGNSDIGSPNTGSAATPEIRLPAGPHTIDKSNASAPVPVDLGAATVPVFGSAAGGYEGHFVLNGERLADILAPSSLKGVHDAYAVYVSGDSMEPRYFQSEAVFVNPKKPVAKGDFVVIQVFEGSDDDPELHCYVKRFQGTRHGDVVCDQFNPPKELLFPRARLQKVHKIVASGEG